MVWAANLPQDTSKIRLSANYIRQNNTAIQGVLTATNLTNATPYIPTTHPMWFYANTVPTGWTAVATTADILLGIKAAGATVYTTGGTVQGTWTGPSHTLTTAEMPAHAHTVDRYDGGGGTSGLGSDSNFQGTVSTTTVGGGGSHSHDWTSTRPLAAVGILASKDA